MTEGMIIYCKYIFVCFTPSSLRVTRQKPNQLLKTSINMHNEICIDVFLRFTTKFTFTIISYNMFITKKKTSTDELMSESRKYLLAGTIRILIIKTYII